MKKNRTFWWLIVVFILFLIGGIQSYFKFSYQRNLNDCIKQLGSAIVTDTRLIYIKTSGLWVYYQFEYKAKTYGGRENIGLNYRSELRRQLLNKAIPVVFCKDDPNVNAILVTPEQFSSIGYKYPDSLKWIDLYRKK